uniref:G-protein coupled receptors family 1 profile domain-containing protein n=1 Tax=Octopus bimaculoides TaxID=37653 RepID=A0A0L8FWH3_OCTBM
MLLVILILMVVSYNSAPYCLIQRIFQVTANSRFSRK